MPATYRQDASRQGLISLVLVIAIIAAVWFLLWPKYASWRQAKSELAAVNLELQRQQSTLDAINRLVANYRLRSSELAILEASLPNAPKVPEFIANLEFLVGQSGLQMGSLKITDPTLVEANYNSDPAQTSETPDSVGSPKLVELEIELALEGEHNALRRFLVALELNLRLLEVKSIIATPTSGGESDTRAAFGLVLGTSYLRPLAE